MTDDLISRQAALDDLHGQFFYRMSNESMRDRLDCWAKNLPAAKPETSRWIKVDKHIYKCEKCRNYLDFDGVNAGRGDANFCPNCGAKMEDEDDRND